MKADAELRATPIMAVTAYAAKGDEERIRDAGAEGYVSKPISVVRFVEAVAALLAAAAERAAAEAEASARSGSRGRARNGEAGTNPGESRGPDDGDEGAEEERAGSRIEPG